MTLSFRISLSGHANIVSVSVSVSKASVSGSVSVLRPTTFMYVSVSV